MMETPVITKGEKAGIATMPEGGAVETRIKSYQYNVYSGMKAVQDHYLKYRQTNKVGAMFETITGRRGSKMSRAEFNEEIAKAMRRNDESEIPEVAAAAKQIRRDVFDPIKEKAIEEGLLDEGVKVKGADSYLTRMYNFEKIVQNRHQWDSILKEWLKRDAVKAAEEQGSILELKQMEGRPFDVISDEYIATADKAKRAELRSEMQVAARREGKTDYDPYFTMKSEIDGYSAKITEAKKNEKTINAQIAKEKDSQKIKELGEQLQDWKRSRIDLENELKKQKSIFNQIKKARKQDQSISSRIESGKDDTLQSIVNSITDKILGGAGGRLDYDISPTVKGPLKERTLSIRDELIEDFLVSDIESIMGQYVRTMAPDIELKRMFGSLDLGQEIEAVNREYSKLRKGITSQSDLKKLDSRMRADIRDIEAMRDRLRGTYRMPEDPNSAIFRMGQFLMGLNFVRMLGGMTLSAIPDAARIVARNGFGGTARGMKGLTNFKQFGLAKTEARKAGVGLEMVLNSRAATLNDLNDIYAGGTKLEKGLRVMTDTFGKVSLMTQWNDTLKVFSGVMAQDRFIGDAIKLADGTLSKARTTRLAAAGIDKNQAEAIVEQFRKHGTDGDLRIGNVDNWEDDIARDVFKMALLKDVDATIMTPGAGVKPLWTSGPVGKLIFQFKTFAAEAHHKILLSDLQHRDAAAVSNLLMMSSLGVLTYGIKQYARGNEVETDPAKLVVEGLDNSGVLGYFWDINNTIEKASRGTIGVSPLVGESTMSRYASRSAVSALLGPSLGTASDAVLATGAIVSGDVSESDIRTMRKLLPYQNLFYVRRLLDEIEKPVSEAATN
jgi:predicted  nucleic acid-binding Zn-ribbon protein